MKSITTDKLTKRFDSGNLAVNNIDLSVDSGTVFGFLGPNGAGKTTTVKLLCGILNPTSGISNVLDMDPGVEPEKVHAKIGVITENAQMYGSLTGQQNLVFYGSLYGIHQVDAVKRAEHLLKELDIWHAADQKLNTYSTGMKQRLAIARSLIPDPEVLFLDEPTSGLDPESIMSVNNMISNLSKQEGKTIFLCTHQLRYAQEICDEYGLIDQGTMLAIGDIDTLRSKVSQTMTISIKADKFPDDLNFKKRGESVGEISVQSEKEIPMIVKKIIDDGGSVYEVNSSGVTLEEIYFALIDDKKGVDSK